MRKARVIKALRHSTCGKCKKDLNNINQNRKQDPLRISTNKTISHVTITIVTEDDKGKKIRKRFEEKY